MFLGTATTRNGSFNFTLDTPQAEPGIHLIKALNALTLARASPRFLVLASPSSLEVSVSVGSVYFPGETAVISVLTSINGVPSVPAGVQLQVILFKPDGSNTTLTLVPLTSGYYKATFLIPKAGGLGTYVIVASAHIPGPADSSALKNFEVKPSWLTAHGPTVTGATTLAGMVGLLTLAWKRGYLREKNAESDLSP